ncbi:MAG: hypothetical protein ACKPKO_54880, partial [Candidatus Fonsibacter sp.]
TDDMADFLRSCLERYKQVAPGAPSLRNYVAPFLAEDHRNAPAGKPGAGPVKECPWCFFTGSPSSVFYLFLSGQASRSPEVQDGDVCCGL